MRWVCNVQIGPAQPLTTAGEEPDDLSADRSRSVQGAQYCIYINSADRGLDARNSVPPPLRSHPRWPLSSSRIVTTPALNPCRSPQPSL